MAAQGPPNPAASIADSLASHVGSYLMALLSHSSYHILGHILITSINARQPKEWYMQLEKMESNDHLVRIEVLVPLKM